MINLRGGEIKYLLPENLVDDDVKALSYALGKVIERMLDYADDCRIFVAVSNMPEKILDVLAIELRSPYYDVTMDLETKRQIIKNTLIWHSKAGTPSAVNELIGSVFGYGRVIEWFDFVAEPYTPGTFDIETNGQITEERIDELKTVIEKVKNVRSHLRNLTSIGRMINSNSYTGVAVTARSYIKIL